MAFERRFSDIQNLKAEPLFRKCLLPDILQGGSKRGVFPAVRKDRMDFYHRGGKLFSYEGHTGFTTHHKYASVIRSKTPNQYVTETGLQVVESFSEGYERIKENCSLYSGVEAIGVSRVYGNFSCAKRNRSHDVVVLDIEISLRRSGEPQKLEPSEEPRTRSDRIDLLLFDTKSGILRFFEAKDFSNKEIRATPGREPKIVKQMNRYERQLSEVRVREEMLAGYTAQADVINKLFRPEMPLPAPRDIDPTPRLLLFGFDRVQLTGKLQAEVARLEQEHGLCVYAIGDIKKVNPQALFSGGRKRWRTVQAMQ